MFPLARFFALAATLTIIITLASSQKTHAATFVVNSTNDTVDSLIGNGVCSDSLGNCTLRAAIQEANSLAGNDTITFSVTGTINLTGALPDLTNITINGPGSSLLTVRRDTGGDYRIFFSNGFTVNISGLTVTNGRTPDGASGSVFGGSAQGGGGIFSSGVMTLTDVVVTGNRTGNGGMGGTSTGGFGGDGGGIIAFGTLTMTNCTVSNNLTGNGAGGANGGSGGRGGGIFAVGTLTITQSLITTNNTGSGAVGNDGGGGGGGNGGGIWAENGPVNLTNAIISGNHAGNAAGQSGAGGHGGGIILVNSNTTLTNSAVTNNTTGNGTAGFSSQAGVGGGIFKSGGTMTVTGTTISGNATGSGGPGGGSGGGGIFNSGALNMSNSTISANTTGNQSGIGVGLINSGPSTVLTNCTIAFNHSMASFGGAGIHHGTASDGLTIRNTIVAGNTRVGSANGPDVEGLFSSEGHNIVGNADGATGFPAAGDQVGTTASPINPQLGSLADNGGPTQTHALLAGSPALDAGNNLLAKDASNNTLTTDQRGAGRFANAAGGGGPGTVDIGSFEFHPFLEDVSDKTTNEDTSLLVPFNVGDGVSILSVSASSDNQTLVPNANLSITGTGPMRTLEIVPAANQSGTANITITVNESGGGVRNDSFMLTVTSVNDAPTFTKGADQTVSEDSGAQTVANWATGLNAGPGESGQTLSFLITGNTNPGLFSVGPAVSPSGTLTYTPAANANGSATITIVLKDDGGTANGGQDTSAAQTFIINVTAVNDAPTADSQAVTASEDTGQFITLTGSDIEGSVLTFIIVSGPAHGTLSAGTGAFRTYLPQANFSGSDSFTFKVNDGVADSAEATVSITVNAVNDAPVNTVPGTQATNASNTVVFSAANSNAITVSDVDAGSDPVQVTLSVTNGTLTLGGNADLTFNTGDGTEDTTMTFTGTISAVNAAWNGLTFKPNLGFFGNAFLQVTVNDQGHNGSGGARSDSDSVTIIVSQGGVFQFSSVNFVANERDRLRVITVTRVGNTTQAATVGFGTFSNTASDRRDFTAAVGTLHFGPGENSKTFFVLITLDSFVEGTESAGLTLFNPTGGAVLGSPSVAFLQINDAVPPQATNPIDEAQNFVRQHYHDFLSREPDAAGLDFWTREITDCGTDLTCIEVKRINVSAAFYLSIEFQETGFFVYRMFKSAYGDTTSPHVSIPVPIIRLHEFIPDAQRVGFGVQVGIGNWEMDLETNKRNYALEFVATPRFLNAYPLTMTPAQFVDQLNLRSGGVLSQTERDQLIAELTAATDVTQGRASVLRKVADDENLRQAETNRAFVLMQYYGYLRRNPDDLPDSDFRGWEFWLNKLNQFNGNFIHAEMVKAFISSIEYRQRFGQ